MANPNDLRVLIIPASLTRPIQILGCDRVLLPVVSLFCVYVGFILGFAQGRIYMIILALMVWFICYRGLIVMGKKDPYMREIIARSMRFSDKPFLVQFFIPAKGTLRSHAPISITKRGWL